MSEFRQPDARLSQIAQYLMVCTNDDCVDEMEEYGACDTCGVFLYDYDLIRDYISEWGDWLELQLMSE